MTESLLKRSARYIDGGVYEGPRAGQPRGSLHQGRRLPRRRERELSLMARGLYLDATRTSDAVSEPEQATD